SVVEHSPQDGRSCRFRMCLKHALIDDFAILAVSQSGMSFLINVVGHEVDRPVAKNGCPARWMGGTKLKRICYVWRVDDRYISRRSDIVTVESVVHALIIVSGDTGIVLSGVQILLAIKICVGG